MPHFLIIDDSFPINTRNQKIVDSLAAAYPDARVSVVTWDREGKYDGSLNGYHVYDVPSAYGNKLKKFCNMFGFGRYCRKCVKALTPDVVIASHWNNLILVPSLDRRRQMLVYENLDVPTEGFVVRKISTWLEHRAMERVDLIVHASRFFPSLYDARFPQIILENKPVFATTPVDYAPSHPLRIAFMGVVRYPEILGGLIDAVRGDARFELAFHGSGHALDYLKQYARGCKNVTFTGRYNIEDIANLYQQTDVVWAGYPNRDFNVKYAISNKFHESLFFGVPAIYSADTRLGDYVVKNGLGYVVDPYSVSNIKTLFEYLLDNKESLLITRQNMLAQSKEETTWEHDFIQLSAAIDKFLG